MTLITIILIVLGCIIYAITGNLLVRYLDSKLLIFDVKLDEFIIFILGIFLPLLLLYILISEISLFLWYIVLDYFENEPDESFIDENEYEHNLKRKENGKKSKKRDRYYI
jgi:hypothetical protein